MGYQPVLALAYHLFSVDCLQPCCARGGSRPRLLERSACGFLTRHLAGLRSHQYAIHGRAIGTGISKKIRKLHWSSVHKNSTKSSSDANEEGEDAGSDGRARRASPSSSTGSVPGQPLLRENCGAGETLRLAEESGGANDGRDGDEVDAREGPAGAGGIGIDPLDVDNNGSNEPAECNVIKALFELTGTTEVGAGSRGHPLPPSEYNYASLSTKVCAVYESLDDIARSQPLVQRRRGAQPGRFKTPRLRALLHFALQIGGDGMSYRELRLLYDFLDVWCGTKPDTPTCDAEPESLREAFPSVSAFVDGVKDELDDAVIDAGWKKVLLTEGGVTFEAYFRPVLDLIMKLAKRPGVRLWSGKSGPAPPTDRRQSPMDGDAFRECENDVILNNGAESCVLGVHAYSDGSRLSWSGGSFLRALKVMLAMLLELVHR